MIGDKWERGNMDVWVSGNDPGETHRRPYLLNPLRVPRQRYFCRGSLPRAQDRPQRATITGYSVRHFEAQKRRGYGIHV